MYLSTSTSTEDFPEMYLSTFQVLYKLYLSTDVLKYKVLLPGSVQQQSKKERAALFDGPVDVEWLRGDVVELHCCLRVSVEGFDHVLQFGLATHLC